MLIHTVGWRGVGVAEALMAGCVTGDAEMGGEVGLTAGVAADVANGVAAGRNGSLVRGMAVGVKVNGRIEVVGETGVSGND